MRYPIRELLLSTALLCAVSARGDAQTPTPEGPTTLRLTVPNFVPVTDAMLRAPKREDWLLYRGNYQGWGYSSLEQINKSNVKNLQLVWSRMMAPGLNEITPIVHDGVMYLGNPGDVIQATDAASGDLFAGDAAGVALPGSRYVRPPTPPPELDVDAWERTLARLRALRARRLLLTHFGPHTWVNELLDQMRERLRAAVALVRAGVDAGERDEQISERLRALVDAALAATDGPGAVGRYEVIMATQQSALGLIRYVRRQRPPGT